jgi:hypothetical protein
MPGRCCVPCAGTLKHQRQAANEPSLNRRIIALLPRFSNKRFIKSSGQPPHLNSYVHDTEKPARGGLFKQS